MKNFLPVLWNRALGHVFEFYGVISSDFKSRLLSYIVPTFVGLVLTALMVLPVGVPIIGSITSYWWADAANQEFVGQGNKWFWYRKSILTVALLALVVAGVWLWRRLLYSRGKSAGVALLLAYMIFVAVPIGTQCLVMGDWTKMGDVTFSSGSWSGPSHMTIASRIDSVPRYLSHMTDYAGVEGQLMGLMRNKAPGFVLTYYAFDQVNLRVGRALGLGSLSLQERGILVGVDFLLVTGLCLFPLYFTAKKIFSKNIALIGVMIFSLTPMVSFNFGDAQSWNYLLMMPETALAMLFLVHGLDKRSWLWTMMAIVVAAVGMLFNWASLALLVLCLMYMAARLRWATDDVTRKMASQAPRILIILLILSVAAIGLIWLATGINMIVFFWDTFVIGAFLSHDMLYSLAHLFTGSGIKYLASLPASVFEFFFWCGIPISLQFILSLVRLVKSKRGASTQQIPGRLLVVVFVLFIAILALSSFTFDTRRIWAFLAPVFLIAGMYELEAIKQEKVAISAGLVLFGLQAIQVVVCRSVFEYSHAV